MRGDTRPAVAQRRHRDGQSDVRGYMSTLETALLTGLLRTGTMERTFGCSGVPRIAGPSCSKIRPVQLVFFHFVGKQLP